MQIFLQRGVSFVVGVAVGLAAAYGWSRVNDFHIGRDPLAYVHVIDDTFPIDGDVDAMRARLDADTGATWTMRAYQPGLAGADDSLPRNLGRLQKAVQVPTGSKWPLQAVMTNVLEPTSATLGSLYVVWFRDAPLAEDWLRLDQPVFIDKAVEARRRTYWAGQLVIYYSPPAGGTDRSGQVRQWGAEVVDCPRTVGRCSVSGKAG